MRKKSNGIIKGLVALLVLLLAVGLAVGLAFHFKDLKIPAPGSDGGGSGDDGGGSSVPKDPEAPADVKPGQTLDALVYDDRILEDGEILEIVSGTEYRFAFASSKGDWTISVELDDGQVLDLVERGAGIGGKDKDIVGEGLDYSSGCSIAKDADGFVFSFDDLKSVVSRKFKGRKVEIAESCREREYILCCSMRDPKGDRICRFRFKAYVDMVDSLRILGPGEIVF